MRNISVEVEVEDADQVQRLVGRHRGHQCSERHSESYRFCGPRQLDRARFGGLRSANHSPQGFIDAAIRSLSCCSRSARSHSAAAVPADEFTIVVIPKGLTHEHWQSVRRGAERCAADLLAEEDIRVRIIFDGPLRERDAMEQIRIVDRRVATGANGIVLAPQHSRTMTACVKRAADAGVPVVVIDSGLAETEHFVKYVATDNYNGGCLAANTSTRELQKQGKTKPKLILFRYAVGSESTERARAGLRGHGEADLPGGGVAFHRQVRRRDARLGDARGGAARAPVQGPEVDGIFAPNESSASGHARRAALAGAEQEGAADGLRREQAAAPGDPGGRHRRQHPARPVSHGLRLDVVLRAAHPGREHQSRPARTKELCTGEHVVIEKEGQLITTENSDPEFVRGLYDPATQARRTDRLAALPEGAEAMTTRLRMTGIRKSYGPTAALRGVDLELLPGEVHAARRRERGGQVHADEGAQRRGTTRRRRR